PCTLGLRCGHVWVGLRSGNFATRPRRKEGTMSILVRHAMTESPQTISPNMNAFDAAGLMKSEDVGVLPVVWDGRLVGLVTDRDLVLRVLAERQSPVDVKVGDIATRTPVTIRPDM